MNFETNYSKKLHSLLTLGERNGYRVLDLFAGCGGLALGFEAAGFETIGFEANKDCCETYSKNLISPCHEIFLSKNSDFPSADIVVGGPPCQPFSVGGKQLGLNDERNGFPAFINAIEKVKPQMWMFENVRGLLYKNKWYLEEVIAQLEDLGYVVEHQLLNAVHFGVPQNRERLIVVGHRKTFSFPTPLENKVTAAEALGDYYRFEPDDGKYLTPSMDKYIANYEAASKCINPRDLHPNKPARTLTCRNLAGATGDMHRIALPSGKRRRLTHAEAARLQSFPDWYKFHGNETSIYNQIGNSVAPLFAFHLANSMLDALNSSVTLSSTEIKKIKSKKQIELSL